LNDTNLLHRHLKPAGGKIGAPWLSWKADAESAPMLFAKVREGLLNDKPTVETEYVGAKEYRVIVFPKGPSPDLLIRYESNIERQIARTSVQLEGLQPLRQSAPEPPGGLLVTNAN
jgi:hypothetical protein